MLRINDIIEKIENGFTDTTESQFEKDFWKSIQIPLKPQHKVANIRADFIVQGTNIVIECDGREFHESAEATVNDRLRDHIFHHNGYRVIRIDGHTFYHSPDKVIWYVSKLINDNLVGEETEYVNMWHVDKGEKEIFNRNNKTLNLL